MIRVQLHQGDCLEVMRQISFEEARGSAIVEVKKRSTLRAFKRAIKKQLSLKLEG